MISTIYVYTGAGGVIPQPTTGPGGTNIAINGMRIIPLLAPGASRADLEAAYDAIELTLTKQTQNYPQGTTEDLRVVGPDWHNLIGVGQVNCNGGGTPNNWLIQWATDCKEMVQVSDPALAGFGATSGSGTGGTVTTTATTKNFTGTAPSAAGDGVDITNAKAVKVSYKAANAGATLNAAGSVKVYGYSTGASRWVRMPDLDYVPTEAVVEPMAFGPQPYSIPFGVGRVCFVPSALTASAGTQVNEVVEVLT